MQLSTFILKTALDFKKEDNPFIKNLNKSCGPGINISQSVKKYPTILIVGYRCEI